MPFIKVSKSNSYFKRFQTKFRRRRECKTDYYARKRMCTQDLNKYNTPKYRLVVRITQHKIIAQVFYSTLAGDVCMIEANSNELKKWGLTTAYTSYPVAYCTGLLCARRLLNKLGLDKMFPGQAKIDGLDYDVTSDAAALKQDKRPFKAILDIGTCVASTGNRVFGVLKGACDGGLDVPHSVKKWPGVDKEDGKYHPEPHKDRILGKHIDTYMAELKGESEEDYEKQFSKWDKCLKANKVGKVEDLFVKIHAAIRKDPAFTKKARGKQEKTVYLDDRKTRIKAGKKEYTRSRRYTHAERKMMLNAKIQAAMAEQE
jgi:large subunit ribosomal protein L5e